MIHNLIYFYERIQFIIADNRDRLYFKNPENGGLDSEDAAMGHGGTRKVQISDPGLPERQQRGPFDLRPIQLIIL